MLREQVVQGLGHGAAGPLDGPAAAGVLAQHRRDANGAHEPATDAGRAGSAAAAETPSPQAGQAGSRQMRTSSKLVLMASNISSLPASGLPTPRMSLKTSLAWMMPAIPGSTPSTPATLQAGASSGGGWVGYMHR